MDRYTDGGNSVWATDPDFMDEAGGDYSLNNGSPMMIAGTGSTTDINGNLLDDVDIGAYEFLEFRPFRGSICSGCRLN
jgi:hypothetical protein